MKKLNKLAVLPLLALGAGALINTQSSVDVKADEPQTSPAVIVSRDVYTGTLDMFEDGYLSPDDLFHAGFYGAQGHADYEIRTIEISGKQTKVLDMTVIADDGYGSSKMLVIGSAGLTDLAVGQKYTISMYLDLSQMTGGELFLEYAAQSDWTGVKINTSGVVHILDGNHAKNASYNTETKMLTFDFVAKQICTDKLDGQDMRPYFHFTIVNSENSDIITFGDMKFTEKAATFEQDFENIAVGTPLQPTSFDITNFYNKGMPDSKVATDGNGNNYLQVTWENTKDTMDWNGFYINRLNESNSSVVSGHTYRLTMDVLDNNFREMYVKYHDSDDRECNTFLPDGTIAEWSNPSEYLTNAYWDGTKLCQEITISSSKHNQFWPQIYIEFCVPAETTLDVKIDNIKLEDITTMGVTELKVSGADSFVKGTEFSASDLVVKGVRNGEEIVLDNYSLNSSAFNKDVVGEYDISVSIADDTYTLSKTYKASVHNNVSGVTLKSAPSKLSYKYNEDLDLTGAVIEVTREDGSKENVNVTAAMVTGFNKTLIGEQTLTVSYLDHSFTFKVTVSDYATGISVKTAPASEVNYGEDLNLANAKITVTNASGATNDVAMTSSMLSGFNKNQLGEQTITVTYEGKTATFTVTVVDYLASISMKSNPTKVEYELNEELDLTGAKIETSTASGVKNEVDVVASMVTGFDSSTAGQKTLTVTYEGKTTTFVVTIKAPYVPEPEAKSGCGGSVVAACGLVSMLAIAGASLLGLKKKED